MTHTYHISGMTCNGCKAKVELVLSELPQIQSVIVNLEKQQATLTMNSHLEVNKLQEALPEKYQISEVKSTNVFISAEEEKSKLKQLFPLILILSYIAIASVLLNYKNWVTSQFMFDFMGLFYIVFSFFKFLDIKGFAESFRMYDPLAKKDKGYAFIYPWIELILGVLFLSRIGITAALIITIIVLGFTTIGVAKVLLNKKSIQCACLGSVLKLPMTTATIIENSIMLIMASFMLVKILVL